MSVTVTAVFLFSEEMAGEFLTMLVGDGVTRYFRTNNTVLSWLENSPWFGEISTAEKGQHLSGDSAVKSWVKTSLISNWKMKQKVSFGGYCLITLSCMLNLNQQFKRSLVPSNIKYSRNA